jgi:hypothetical protein
VLCVRARECLDMVGTHSFCQSLDEAHDRLFPLRSVRRTAARSRDAFLDPGVSGRVSSSPLSRPRKPPADKGKTNVETTDRSGPSLPNFLVIGAMKAGTTSLYHYLRAHPQVFMPAIKELDFFVAEANWARGLQWYQKQFARAGPDAVAVGEASARYTTYPTADGVPERIVAHLPEVRLVYVVRDPVERIRSHYRHDVAVGTKTASLERAVLDNPNYVDWSRYATQVERYLEFFSRSQLLIVASEDLRHSRLKTIQRIYAFLGVDSEYIPGTLDREYLRTDERAIYSPAVERLRYALKRRWPASKRAKEFVDTALPRSILRVARRRNAQEKSHPVPDRLRSELEELLKDDVRRLRAYMGDGFDGWGIA